MKSIGRSAVAQWTKRLTRNGQTRVRIREAHVFDILQLYTPWFSRCNDYSREKSIHAHADADMDEYMYVVVSS